MTEQNDHIYEPSEHSEPANNKYQTPHPKPSPLEVEGGVEALDETDAIGTRVDSNCQKKRELAVHCILRRLCRCHCCGCINHLDDKVLHMSPGMRFPTMWYVRPAKPQISMRIRAV